MFGWCEVRCGDVGGGVEVCGCCGDGGFGGGVVGGCGVGVGDVDVWRVDVVEIFMVERGDGIVVWKCVVLVCVIVVMGELGVDVVVDCVCGVVNVWGVVVDEFVCGDGVYDLVL